MALPSGVVTFLFTDIEGSTSLWDAHPRAMQSAMLLHNSIIEQAVLDNHGTVFKHVGDGLCAAFSSPSEAIASALAAQSALLSEEWGELGGLRIRMGLHAGEVEQQGIEYVGIPLSIVSRLVSSVHGEQIVVSGSTPDLVGYNLPNNASLLDLGTYQLRGLVEPQQVFQLVHPSLPREFPPLRIAGPVVGNLPVELTNFVGRADEIRRVGELLSDARLLTITGIGGAGKTRLALKVAEEQQEFYPDGVWLVELASLSDPSLVNKEVTSTIGSLDKESAADKKLLTVLDTCEHLVDACAKTAAQMLQQAPLSRILATSQEPLGVPGEVIYRVPPLSVPPSTDLAPESLSVYEAVSLFVERAKSAEPNFALTEATGPSVSYIARRLDGIPLAIELAAARVNMLSVDETAKRLDDMFRLLTGNNRTALTHHRTLEAAIDWSYRLLSGPEQRLFNRLSVFRGSFPIEGAEGMAGADGDQNLDALEVLTQLVSKSIVTVERREGRPTRYRLLGTLQQYAWDRLQESDEVTEIRDRHTRFFLDIAQGVEAKLRSTGSVGLLVGLKVDQDNLRAAWDWARESNNPKFVESESMGSLTSLVMSF